MNLPFLKKRTEPENKREYLFALEIGHESIKSAIWAVVNKKTQVLSIGQPVAWNETQPADLITAADKSLSDATARLDDTGKTQPQKLILGLPSDWVVEDKIIPEHLKLLKELTHKLSLTAIGFVVTPQALIRHLHHVEGVPPTTILIGVGQTSLEITLVRLGKMDASHQVRRSQNIPADVIEGLNRFGKVDMLPSRILIYDSVANLEDIKQQLLSYPWQAPQSHLTFLHFPKIEVLPPDFSIKAISLSGGSEVATAIGLIPPGEVESTPQDLPREAPVTSHDLGFTAEGDLESGPAPEDSPNPAPSSKPKFSPPKIAMPKLSFPSFHLPSLPSGKKTLPLVLVGVLILVGLLGWAYWTLPRAKVTLTITPQVLDSKFDVSADASASAVDASSHTLPAHTATSTVSQDAQKNTTGTKLVGDKATGEVTIINGTPTVHSFPAGTVISSPADLKYTLDSAVDVASASGTADPNSYSPGKTNVKVTASVIGSDSNLSAGTQFKISSFSTLDFVAKNDSALSGGTSRQVAAVSKDDLAALRTQVLEGLKKQARDQLTSDLSEGERLVDSTVTTQISAENYDHKVEDIADKVSLSMSVKATALVFNEQDLSTLADAEIAPQIPEGFKMDGQPAYSFTVNSSKNNITDISVDASASLLPQIDIESAVKNLTGKNPDQVKSYFSNIPAVTAISFDFTPDFPSFLRSLPHVSKNLTIQVTAVH